MFGSWAMVTILAGSILMSFHQPFRAPTPAILQLAQPATNGQTRAIHLLLGSCGCSHRVMQHLLARKPQPGLAEQIVLLDGPAPDLPDTASLAAGLVRAGYAVRRINSAQIPPDVGLRGVPLLIVAAPNDDVLYMGGYGSAYDQDTEIFHQIELKQPVQPLAAIGCAVSGSVRRQADPFHLKY